MKRIIRICGIMSVVILFFTGCNSLAGSLEVDSKELQQSVAESESMNVTGPQIEQEIPQYFEQNMQEKFQQANAPRAFQIKSEHSQDTGDLEDFQIGALLPDKTFIYGYSTRMRDGIKPRDMVHCAAFYNAESGNFRVFHENIFSREWEDAQEKGAVNAEDDEEAFTIQVYDTDAGEKEIFIYDNGEGYIYRMDGTVKLHVDIAGFVHLQYPNVYSVSVVHAVTDGENRIYLELSIEKEPVNINLDDEDASVAAGDAEATEKELEELEKEMADKVENVILVYEVHALTPELHQKNEHFEEQVNAWIEKADGQEFPRDEAPDGGADWDEVMEELPNQWGGADISNMENMAVYEWKDDAVFLYEDEVCTFVPDPQAYVPFVNMTEGWEFWKQFIPYAGHYSRIYGKVGEVTYDEEETFSRTFTLTWTETSTDEEGNEVSEEKSESKTQKLVLDTRNRYAPLQDAYIESYWALDKAKAAVLGNAVGREILCSNEQGDAYWILPGGELEKIGTFGEDVQLQAVLDGNSAFLLSYDTNRMRIRTDERHTKSGGMREVDEVIEYISLDGVAQPGSSLYDKVFQDKNKEQIVGGFDGYGGIYLTGAHVLRTGLSLGSSLVDQLLKFGENVFVPSGQGYLITVPDKGLLYYDTVKKRSMTLLSGSWYRSWKQGNTIVSIGFSGTASYNEMDIAFSRIYEYELNEMVNSAMTDTLNAYKEQERREQESALEKAKEDMTRESIDPEETVEDMAERWNREHPPEEREQAASEALEELLLPED